MTLAIEILRVGPNNDLFQICDGERFGLVEFDAGDPAERERRLRHPHVLAYMQRWLQGEGALTGSQHPPRLEWIHIEIAVVAARA